MNKCFAHVNAAYCHESRHRVQSSQYFSGLINLIWWCGIPEVNLDAGGISLRGGKLCSKMCNRTPPNRQHENHTRLKSMKVMSVAICQPNTDIFGGFRHLYLWSTDWRMAKRQISLWNKSLHFSSWVDPAFTLWRTFLWEDEQPGLPVIITDTACVCESEAGACWPGKNKKT